MSRSVRKPEPEADPVGLDPRSKSQELIGHLLRGSSDDSVGLECLEGDVVRTLDLCRPRFRGGVEATVGKEALTEVEAPVIHEVRRPHFSDVRGVLAHVTVPLEPDARLAPMLGRTSLR